MLRLSLFTAALIVAAGSSAVAATVLPFTETFSTNNSLWTQNASAAPADWLSSGGVGGASDGYISTVFLVPNLAGTTTTTPVIARATGAGGASNGAFVGDYSNITTVSFYVKSDATFAVPIGLRLGGASPGTAITIDGGLLQAGVGWTKFSFDLTPSNSKILSYEGTPGANNAAKFAAATANVANLQIFLNLSAAGYVAPANSTSVNFSVDNVQVVPEPTSAMLIGLGIPALMLMRRRKAAASVA